MRKFLCLLLTICLLSGMLSGCGFYGTSGLEQLIDAMTAGPVTEPSGSSLGDMKQQLRENETAYEDMTYTRPDMQALEDLLKGACDAASNGDAETAMLYVYDFYDAYDWFYTNYSLADIRCSADLTDSYWEGEYAFCVDSSARVEAALEELYYALAASPICEQLEEEYFGDGWFDEYKGENNWDEAFTALLEEEAALQNRYYELSGIAVDYVYGTEEYYAACGDAMVELLVELIGVRQRIADYWGYSDYPSFATDFYYYRDYTQAQTDAYLADIRRELVPLYEELNESPLFRVSYGSTTETETYDYVRSMALSMGGTVKRAFDLMDRAGLYDIGYGPNKYDSSFEVYLTMYSEPFIFMNPAGSQYDHLTFAHEFGHFCNDFASSGSSAGIDVLEVFSQAMEYLSLSYADGGEDLTKMKLWDSLCLMVEQSAFASFESRMYRLEGEELTAENLRSLYDQVAREYGFESVGYDDREFVTITHFYTNPMYIISYVVSNDSAMQFYQLEQARPGEGLEVFGDHLNTQAYYFLEFLEEAGLNSPFVPGRVAELRETFEAALKS